MQATFKDIHLIRVYLNPNILKGIYTYIFELKFFSLLADSRFKISK